MGLFSPGKRIEAQRAAELLASGAATPLDVRQDIEWKHGHIRGAVHIPLTHVSRRARQLPDDNTIITVCRSGHRSAHTARTLRRAGYQVENLTAGSKRGPKQDCRLTHPEARSST